MIDFLCYRLWKHLPIQWLLERAEAYVKRRSDEQELVELKTEIASVYQMIDGLPITPETMESATAALTQFCHMVGCYDIEYKKAVG